MPNLHQLLWIFEWQRPQQRGIDHAENRRVGSYAQSQCQHCDCSKPRRLTDHAQRIANVLYQSVHYSYLSATMGSTLAARRAGMKLASRPIVKRVLAAVAKVIGSRGLSPNSKLAVKRVLIKDRSSPVAMPMLTTARASRITSRSTPEGLEPSANRSAAARNADRKSTRLNSSHPSISYAVFCLKKKKKKHIRTPNNNTRYSRIMLP